MRMCCWPNVPTAFAVVAAFTDDIITDQRK